MSEDDLKRTRIPATHTYHDVHDNSPSIRIRVLRPMSDDPTPPGSYVRSILTPGRPISGPTSSVHSPARASTAPAPDDEDEWEDESESLEDSLDMSMGDPPRSPSERSATRSAVSSGSARRTPVKVTRTTGSSRTRQSQTTPRNRRKDVAARSPESSHTASPVRPPRPIRVLPRAQSRPGWTRTLRWSLSVAFELVISAIRLFHALFSPAYPYIALVVIGLLALSTAVYTLPKLIPVIIYRLSGHFLRLLFPSFPPVSSLSKLAWWTPGSDGDTALGRGLALVPLRSVATPVCALSGQICSLSLLSTRRVDGSEVKEVIPARPFWEWEWGLGALEVDVGEVARSLAKEAKGAKNIFESVARLSDGEMMDRLGYVRIWELGVAVQVGSNIDDKDMVGKGLVDLGNNAKDLSDELVEINAMAVNAFSWLQWEFASVYKVLSLPSSRRPTPSILSGRLNTLLNRLSETLTDLHRLTTKAHSTATRGSDQGNRLRTHLGQINADLMHQHSIEPGWKAAVDAAQHFLVGGEPSRSELIRRDVKITRRTIDSLSGILHDLEGSRIAIKEFRDHIGWFDAGMMGFHLGASSAGGIGPEEELRVLADVVEEFGRAVGLATGGRRLRGSTDEEDQTRGIEG